MDSLLPTNTVTVKRGSVSPLTYQSGDLSYSDWIVVLTLCFAPLIAHMLAGSPKATYMAEPSRPKWHDRLCFYNPTTIMWRYYAIFSRRVRAREWTATDVATANTVFWTSHGWDGSEYLAAAVNRSHYWKALPERDRPSLESIVKTLIVTLQGAQATWVLVHSYEYQNVLTSFEAYGVNSTFSPIAILGILRFFPALWLSEEYEFGTPHAMSLEEQDSLELIPTSEERPFARYPEHDATKPRPKKNHRTSAPWVDFALRLLLLLFVVALWVMSIANTGAWASSTDVYYMTSVLTTILLYQFLLGTASLIYLGYLLHRKSTPSTVIPCINSTWYKLYSMLLYLFMLVAFIMSAIETRNNACGIYTAWDCSEDGNLCPDLYSTLQLSADWSC